MYAIIHADGRQLRVEEGQVLDIDFREAKPGSELKFDKVLALQGDAGMTIGTPHVTGASVTAEVVGPKMGEKLVIQKFRRRKTVRRKNGHRQLFTSVKIRSISAR